MEQISGIKRMIDVTRKTGKDLDDYCFRNVPVYYTPVKAVWMRNGCCSHEPVIVTVNKRPDGSLNYSCQCGCGGWCTTGCSTEEEAIRQYKRMSAGKNLYGAKYNI